MRVGKGMNKFFTFIFPFLLGIVFFLIALRSGDNQALQVIGILGALIGCGVGIYRLIKRCKKHSSDSSE